MSGLTPILDTLLHHVLGKRGDVRPSPALQADRAVNPVTALTPARPTESDSRLQTRLPMATERAGQPAGGVERAQDLSLPKGAGIDRLGAQQRAAVADGTAKGDTSLRLSHPAQLIAQLQKSGRAQDAPTVRSPGYLLDNAPSPKQAADGVLRRLESSVRDSGFFYEHHLQQWHRGERTLADLSREPQMRLWQNAAVPARLDARGTPETAMRSPAEAGAPSPRSGVAASQEPAEVVLYERTPGPRDTQAAQGGTLGRASEGRPTTSDTGTADKNRPPTVTSDEPRQLPSEAQERLHSIVRSQLELLGTHALRWEGEIDDGFLMFMDIQLPEEAREGRRDEPPPASLPEDEMRDWKTTVELELPLLGDISVVLARVGDRLTIDLAPDLAGTAALMLDRLPGIVERLEARGIASPSIRIDDREDPQ